MSDDVDDLVRRAMATLEAPEGYFDSLADRTLARLDEAPVELAADEEVGEAAVIGEARDEDSGLQDIRSLASEAKARLRRSSQEAIARGPASSAAWRAVAVADPQRAVIGEGGHDAVAHDAVAYDAVAAAPGAIDELAAARALRVAPPKPTAPPVPVRTKRPVLAAAGLAVAVAAGALIFVSTTSQDASAPMAAAPRERVTVARAPEVPPPPVAAPDPAPDPARTIVAETPSKTGAGSAAHGDGIVATKPIRATKGKGGGKIAKLEAPRPDEAPPVQAAEPKPAPAKPAGKDDEPSFDDLVRDANITAPKAAGKKPAKQGLTRDDIRRSMAPAGAAAKRCYAGTAGTATVRVTVASSGQITRVTISGPFAGTPVAACVERAVRAAAFPAWDGGPQTFSTSYLLSD